MSSSQNPQSVSQWLAEIIPRPIGWSRSDRDESRRKFIKIIGGMVCMAIAVGILGFCLLLYPQYATTLLFVQMLCLVTLFGFVLAALACARTCFFDPLRHIRQWASEIREGNFSARVPVAQEGGFAELADDINRLAEWLESLAIDAEEQLRQQAERLASKSQSLQLLYDASALINEAPGNEELIGQYLKFLQTALDAKMGRAYIWAPEGMRLISAVGAPGAHDDQGAGVATPEKIVVPLKYKDQVHGQYELYFDADSEVLASEIYSLLPSIGRHLGMAVEKTRLEQEAIDLSAMEERARVANELHDSLAQSLAGLKFQVRVLDDTIAQGEDPAIWAQMERVEGSLEEATLELRDLIAQFRGSARVPGSSTPIDQVVNQFKRRSDMNLVFHDRWGGIDIPPELERQAGRVVQEALANAKKHSKASTLRVLLRRESEYVIEAIVEDDGVGFDKPATSAHPGEHIGLTIMQERAEQINGELSIDSEPGEGTRVSLRIYMPDPGSCVTPLSGTA